MSDNYERDMALTLDEVLSIVSTIDENKVEMSSGHEKTEEFIIQNNISPNEVIIIVKSINANNFVKGPVPDDKQSWRRNKPVWIFKKDYQGLKLYIKLKVFITNHKVLIVSLHEDE